MTIPAESFAGRVLAVLSRRSPGLRPPRKPSGLFETPQTGPPQDDVTGLSLADVTAHWKSVSPRERLRRRNDLLKVAELLEAAAAYDALDRAPVLTFAVDRALGLAVDLAVDLDLDLACDLAHALNLAHTLERALAVDPDRALDRALALSLARDIAHDLDHALALALDLARVLTLTLNLTRDLDVIEARDNLIDAASNFVGTDLTAVSLAAVDLAGISWDIGTQWPTPEWAARMRSASVEDPPGSGVFVVLPDEGRDFADRGSLAPIS